MVSERPVLTLLSVQRQAVPVGLEWRPVAPGEPDHLLTSVARQPIFGLIVDGKFAEATTRILDRWLPAYGTHDRHPHHRCGGGSIAYVDAGVPSALVPTVRRAAWAGGLWERGDRPTVTDAHVVLGHLDPDHFLGGAMALDADAAQRVIGTLGDALGMGLDHTAEGVLTVVNANMANAIRSRTVQKGLDPRDFSLVAFGGAGPLHGVDVARALGIPEVIVPLYPGITSAGWAAHH